MLGLCVSVEPMRSLVLASLFVATVVHADSVQLGPRPFYLVDQLPDGPLKRDLSDCAAERDSYDVTDFSIGHRGAPLQFPEHTEESYRAAARMGAGMLECDVTFTKDKQLVCRHSQCDLHTTTNILETPLATKCQVPFTPAVYEDGKKVRDARVKCCTSDLTINEFLSLKGKMDQADPDATTIAEYLGGGTAFRTQLYATGGTLITHAQSIELFRSLDRRMTPELKEPLVEMPFDGMSREDYALKLIKDYETAGVSSANVFPQSFHIEDIRTWISEASEFGEQAVLLEGRDPKELQRQAPAQRDFHALKEEGINYLGPPIPALLRAGASGELDASFYARRASRAGLKLLAWTTERSGRVVEDIKAQGSEFYYDPVIDILGNDGDILVAIDVLVKKAGVVGIFSDWPATTTFYANCRGSEVARKE